MVGCFEARRGAFCCGEVWLAWHDWARLDSAWHGMAGEVGRGEAWQGVVSYGKAWLAW